MFLHFLNILKWYSIELLALSPNPLSDLWGRIPKKRYRPRNIDKKFKKFFAVRHNVRAIGNIRAICLRARTWPKMTQAIVAMLMRIKIFRIIDTGKLMRNYAHAHAKRMINRSHPPRAYAR